MTAFLLQGCDTDHVDSAILFVIPRHHRIWNLIFDNRPPEITLFGSGGLHE